MQNEKNKTNNIYFKHKYETNKNIYIERLICSECWNVYVISYLTFF